MTDEHRARPGHEEDFRASWRLRDEVANHPMWLEAYEYAATHKLTIPEMNALGQVLVRRDEAPA